MASVDLQEKANFTRLSRLLVDKGTEALKTTLDAIHPPASLPAVLAANRTSLLKLKPRVINDSQWDLLYPPSSNPSDSNTFDVTLLTVLFRNICGLPKTGWDAIPVETDRSMQANIVRIKTYRNKVYAHVTSTQVDNTTFESLWSKISQALVELNIPQNEVDELKIRALGPEEEVYVRILRDWKLQEESLKDDVTSIKRSVNRLTQITEAGIQKLCQSALEEVPKKANLEKNRDKENEDLLRKLAKHNFKSKIRSKVKFFLPGTRQWLLKELDKWLIGNEHESKILVLTAGPGFGKSVFAAKVCEDFKKKGKLAACHFCDFSDSNLRNPMMMLQSLASQMCENVVGFKEKLLDQLQRPHQVRSLKDAFGIYLQNPLDELEVREPSLVVIDGLDESATDDKNEIVNLIAGYFPDLPDCIKVLVTSRPEISLEKLSGLLKINIKNDNVKNNSDLKMYLKSCLPSLPDRKEESPVFQMLVEMCEGSFLYAFFAQSELQKRDDLDKVKFDEIIKFVPKGLDSIYEAYFKRLEAELKAIMPGNLDVLRVLEMLVACEGPLPLTFVARAFGLASDCRETKNIINKVNMAVSCLLYVSDDLVTVFHKTVIDWLLAKGYKDHEYTVKVSDGNKSLWLICEQIFEDIKKSVCSGHDVNLASDAKYAVKDGLRNLLACNMKERFFWLVDVVIIHFSSTYFGETEMLTLWSDILRVDAVMNDELRARISWHILVMDFLLRFRPNFDVPNMSSIQSFYLQCVLTHSPKGYFNDQEKKIAELLLSKVLRFVDITCNHEVEVMPLAIWYLYPRRPGLAAFGFSTNMTMATIADGDGKISVVRMPGLVEIFHYFSEFKECSCCIFAPDDSFVLFGKLKTVLNIAERKEVPFFQRNEETFTSCAFSPNGKRLVTANGSSTIKLWDVAKQNLLSLLCAEIPVKWCSFSSKGLFIIADRRVDDFIQFNDEDLFCSWNAITLQRNDERVLPETSCKEQKAFRSKLCKRCFLPAFERLPISKRLYVERCMASDGRKIPYSTCSTGIYNGVECIFALQQQILGVIENTHFTTLAAWKCIDHISFDQFFWRPPKITKSEGDMWLFASPEKLMVFRTLVPKCPTKVLWSSFFPDGSRLATCSSDGCINIWNVDTRQVEQLFKSNQDESPFACWWSKEFLFVLFSFCDRIFSLLKYPMDVNLKILFSQSKQVPLGHLVGAIVSLSAVVDFSEGFLIFECGEKKHVKVLDVNRVGKPREVILPGIELQMSISVSPGASFVLGYGKYNYYIWKINAEEAGVYEIFFTSSATRGPSDSVFCFSSDSKVAVVASGEVDYLEQSQIIDLDSGYHKRVFFNPTCDSNYKLFCINKYRIIIIASHQCIEILDMDSGAILDSPSLQGYLTWQFLIQTKLSPNETTLAFPTINGDMEFLRLSIPQNPLLSSIKDKAAIKWDKCMKEFVYF
ncbi:E3 ubiquitin- ligase DZIP3 [Paramuricea clavata]|uniref:E3 ubiquitin- ligase DZIP3 n=1 Tax=Paramuricea clavata TaxID=317549 RepID=A0A6S7IE51_PARCT|nr:E3 ubiquitin- ligase DZIP3 [Paramuricea clavata]